MKTKFKMLLWWTFVGLLAGGLTWFVTGCAVHGGVAYGNGPNGTYYDYYYYPDGGVYFYPQGGLYYWSDGGRWVSGRHLPPRFHIDNSRREPFRGHSRQPWTERGEHHEEREPGRR